MSEVTSWKRVLLVLILGTLANTYVVAEPQDDYLKGMTAYNSGNMLGAIPLFEKAASSGHVESRLMLGYIFDKAEENELAISYYQSLADEGDAKAQFELAMMIIRGEGHAKDEALAVSLIKKSAKKDYVDALLYLANSHSRGLHGLKVNADKAIEYFERASDAGSLRAKEQLKKIAERKSDESQSK